MEDIRSLYAGEPEAMQEALDELDELLEGDGQETVSLHDTNRDAAWAQLAGGG